MADFLKRGAAWLGFVQDDRYSDYEEHTADVELTDVVEAETYDEAAEKRPSATVTPIDQRRAGSVAVAPPTADMSRIVKVNPRTFNEARTIGEHFRDGLPVIMNLTDMEDGDAKRLVDFAAGLIFGLRGTFERVTNKVFLLSPQNVQVTAEDKERIAGGFYNQS
ncbi:MAG TPA: cell division protein SepF [Propionibacteriaceae bacterium]|nr:cell division protein SepF [Propionibacteriaceae bacterium]